MANATKTYIDVAYKDRDLAKRLGARWDPSVKRWYCPSGSTLALIYKWRKAPTPGEMPATVNARLDADLGPVEPTPLESAARASEARVVHTRISKMTPKAAPGARSARAANAPVNFELPLAG